MDDNFMDNGAVLPSGLLGVNEQAFLDGFNKSYKNYALRIGVVSASYPVNNEKNQSKLTTEYDVIVIEQNEDKGATTILYRNCMSAEGLGSMADFFEAALRPKKKKTTKGDSVNLKGQNGATVLLLCLDGMSDKGIIIGALTHPDRKTTLTDEGPKLEGEYNGVNIKVEKDGSTTLTFKGATDNDGKVIDSSQGDTVMSIEKDGSYQVKHKTITQRLAKDGNASLTADGNISNTTKKNFNVTATENIALKATKDFTLDCVKLTAKASGTAMLECQMMQVKAQSQIMVKSPQLMIEAEALASIKATTVTIIGTVSLGSPGGQPLAMMSAQAIGVGNLGIPVLSNLISGFTTSVTAS